MSTITRIKGMIDNTSLPIITETGLVQYWFGYYINALADKGYTLTQTQHDAVDAFINTLTQDDIIDAVKLFYPFIGTKANTAAAKVPLIGYKEFNFGSSFDGFQYNVSDEIVGITKTPAITSLKTSDFCNSECFVMGVSYHKKDTSASPSSTAIDRVINTNNGIQFRAVVASPNGSRGIALYTNMKNTEGTIGKNIFQTNIVPENFNDAGNCYEILGLNSHDNAPYYCRAIKNNNGALAYAAGSTPNRYSPPSQEDADLSLSASLYTNINVVTGIVVFNRVLQSSEISSFINAHKTLNIALGKEI